MKQNLKLKENQIKTISQLEIAREIEKQIIDTKISLELISKIIELEQRKTMEYVAKGYKVIKKNYLTLTPLLLEGKKFYSALTKKEYDIKERNVVKISVGEGFKSFINTNKPMKDKLCRFVGTNQKEAKKMVEKSN